MKYKFTEFNGLKHLRDKGSGVYCPDCGNYLNVVMNGFLHGELFYCYGEKKVFCISLKDITKGATVEYIKSCSEDVELEQIRDKINKNNMSKVIELLKQK